MAERTMLQFDYEEVLAQTVTAVLGLGDGSAGWQSIAIVTSERALLIRVDADTDELTVNLEPAPAVSEHWQSVELIADAVGLELGWCWIACNYLGYLDMFTISFSGLEPQVCFVGEAAKVIVRRIAAAR